MCGIAGLLSDRETGEELLQNVRVMTATLTHRGPDSEGYWTDAEKGAALGFRRLAIIDLSPTGEQPMASASGRYVIVFNGEVYNFGDLRLELEPMGHRFRGHSDTEVILAAIEQWGLRNAVQRFVGMFAFALWDRTEERLHLVRDRLGIKPLYYGWMSGSFLFGSELKALRAHPNCRAEVNRGALTLFLRYNNVPEPLSIYEGIYKLPVGSVLTVQRGSKDASPKAYWSLGRAVENGLSEPYTGSNAQAVDDLERILREAVKLRMIADVPLGAFLSGGIDSSLVVALMQTQSARPVQTFSIGFREEKFNEADFARSVSEQLGTDHTELYVSPREAREVIPRIPEIYDEPFADSSQIPTFLVSQLARRKVTVSLSGDGGDELFGGYERYVTAHRAWQTLSTLPPFVRKHSAGLVGKSVVPISQRIADQLQKSLGRPISPGLHRLSKLSNLVSASDGDECYRVLVSQSTDPSSLVVGGYEPETIYSDRSSWPAITELSLRSMFLDTVTYLPNDILTKVDRASMAVSLEARVPLLDHRVAEFLWTVPADMRVGPPPGKKILRQVLGRYVPPSLTERPKMGFGVPVGEWLRGPLKDWAACLLEDQRLRREGFLQSEPIQQKWKEHLSGHFNWQHYLWNVLMFECWLDRWNIH